MAGTFEHLHLESQKTPYRVSPLTCWSQSLQHVFPIPKILPGFTRKKKSRTLLGRAPKHLTEANQTSPGDVPTRMLCTGPIRVPAAAAAGGAAGDPPPGAPGPRGPRASPGDAAFLPHDFYGLDYCKVNRGRRNGEGFHSQCREFISLFKALTNTLYNESDPCHFWNFMAVRTLHNIVFFPLLLYKAYRAPLKCISFLQLLEAHLSFLHSLSCAYEAFACSSYSPCL